MDHNWRGSGPREHPNKFGTFYVFLQLLKLAVSNLVHKFGWGLAYLKQRLGPKLEGGLARGASKNLGPLRISATVEASNFKFGTQIEFGTSLPKNGIWAKIGGVLARGASQKIGTSYLFLQPLKAREHPKNFGTPYVFLQPLKPATSNLVHKLGLALAYQKTTFWTKIGGGLG